MKDNLLVEALKEIIQRAETDTKYIIYGAGDYGIMMMHWLQNLTGSNPAYFLDRDSGKWNTELEGVSIYNPEILKKEKRDKIKIIVTIEAYKEAISYLEGFGLEYEEQIFDLKGLGRRKPCKLVDPLLGYSRMDDIEGFRILGEETSEKIVILGNSTSDYSNYNVKSWGELLFEKYQRKNKKVAVYIGALPGYCSGQELFKFMRDVLPLDPKAVLTVSGINDPAERKVVEEHPMMFSYTEHLYEKYILNQEKGKALGNGILDIRSMSEIWIQNMRIMRAACEEFGIAFAAFLQPSLHYGKYKMSDGEKDILNKTYSTEQNKRYEMFFQKTVGLIKEQKNIYDLTGIFDGKEGIFIDHCHCNEIGNQLIANKVYKVLEDILG